MDERGAGEDKVVDVEPFIASAAIFAESCASSNAWGDGAGFEQPLKVTHTTARVNMNDRDVVLIAIGGKTLMVVPLQKVNMKCI